MLQQTPRSVSASQPSLITFPEQSAVLTVMLVTSPVATFGSCRFSSGASCGVQELNNRASPVIITNSFFIIVLFVVVNVLKIDFFRINDRFD